MNLIRPIQFRIVLQIDYIINRLFFSIYSSNNSHFKSSEKHKRPESVKLLKSPFGHRQIKIHQPSPAATKHPTEPKKRRFVAGPPLLISTLWPRQWRRGPAGHFRQTIASKPPFVGRWLMTAGTHWGSSAFADGPMGRRKRRIIRPWTGVVINFDSAGGRPLFFRWKIVFVGKINMRRPRVCCAVWWIDCRGNWVF